MKKHIYPLVFITVLCFSLETYADSPDPDPERFAKDIKTFAVWDSKNTFPENAILFVGSSSVRYWSTATAFPDRPIINRGFGGSEISDVIQTICSSQDLFVCRRQRRRARKDG